MSAKLPSPLMLRARITPAEYRRIRAAAARKGIGTADEVARLLRKAMADGR